MRVSEAIVGRQSIRAFLSDKPVTDDQIKALLNIAGRAPSGSNIQPWHVYVVRGETKARITDACEARYLSGDEGEYEYHYYPRAWREPYIGRRRQTGFGLYGLLGIDRKDTEAVQGYRVQNYQFFGAPVGLFFTIDINSGESFLFTNIFMTATRMNPMSGVFTGLSEVLFCNVSNFSTNSIRIIKTDSVLTMAINTFYLVMRILICDLFFTRNYEDHKA